VPTPWVDPDRHTHERPASRASKVLATIVFALMSVFAALSMIVYVATLAESTFDELGGGLGITLLTMFEAAIMFGWWKSLRAMRKRVRPRGVDWRSDESGATRRGRGRIRTFVNLTFRRPPPSSRYYRDSAPFPQQQSGVGAPPGISAARTQLTLTDIRTAQHLPGGEAYSIANGDRREQAKPIGRLSGIERSIGNALYQLDRVRSRRQVSREQIAEVRITGLAASAWLSDHAHRVDLYGHAALSEEQVADGIDRYEKLSRAAEDLVTGRGDLIGLTWALERLRALVLPASTS
jgi:hypothetical protein